MQRPDDPLVTSARPGRVYAAARGAGSADAPAPQTSADAVAPSAQPIGPVADLCAAPKSLAPDGRGPETLAGPVGLSGQLWSEEDQRLAQAAIARDDAKHWALTNPCAICGFPVGDHSELHAQSCYRAARVRYRYYAMDPRD